MQVQERTENNNIKIQVPLSQVLGIIIIGEKGGNNLITESKT